MPLHIFLSQSLSLVTGGLSVWKVAKDVVVILLVVLTVLLVIARKQWREPPFLMLLLAAAVYVLLHAVTFQGETTPQVALLALVYNNRVLWFALLGVGAGLLARPHLDQQRIIKVVLLVSTVVCVFGLLQYMLPKDIMTHFGYAVERGVKPIFFIDDKPDLPRIMATLRDPNSLGGYLVVPITLLTYLIYKAQARRRYLLAGVLGLHGAALFLTFSRSAWAATAFGLGCLLVVTQRRHLQAQLRRFWPVVLTSALMLAAVGYLGRDHYVIQNIIFHSDETTASELDSNDYHLLFARLGVEGIVERPFGHGPGTAGIVSIQNKDGGLLTENYYIQIAYEAGVVGGALFLSVLFFVYRVVLKQRTSILQAVVLASFWGYAAMALLTHLWTNETIAAQWWVLAGLVMAGVGTGKESLAAGHGTASRRSHRS